METVDGLHPLAALLRRYAFAYTACHDFAACRELMVDDYVLIMGEHKLHGRDENYIPATEKQYRQYPGLGFTVHDLVLTKDRAALHFTEHGWSSRHGGYASWRGISLYRWNGERLLECRVEQDYYARREQQAAGVAEPVAAPALDPWTTHVAPSNPETERAVRAWLCGDGLGHASLGCLDNEHVGARPERILVSRPEVTVLDLFTAGRSAAFQIVTCGLYAGGLPDLGERRHATISVHATGIASVSEDGAIDVTAVTDRLAAERRLEATQRRRG